MNTFNIDLINPRYGFQFSDHPLHGKKVWLVIRSKTKNVAGIHDYHYGYAFKFICNI